MVTLFLILTIIAGHRDSEHVQLDAKLNDLVPLDGPFLPFCWRFASIALSANIQIQNRHKYKYSMALSFPSAGGWVHISKLCQHRYEEENTNQWSARVVSISRREWEFFQFNLVHRDETENSWHLLSGFETRPRKNFLQSQASRRDRDLLSLLSGIETRMRIPLILSWFSRR